MLLDFSFMPSSAQKEVVFVLKGRNAGQIGEGCRQL